MGYFTHSQHRHHTIEERAARVEHEHIDTRPVLCEALGGDVGVVVTVMLNQPDHRCEIKDYARYPSSARKGRALPDRAT